MPDAGISIPSLVFPISRGTLQRATCSMRSVPPPLKRHGPAHSKQCFVLQPLSHVRATAQRVARRASRRPDITSAVRARSRPGQVGWLVVELQQAKRASHSAVAVASGTLGRMIW